MNYNEDYNQINNTIIQIKREIDTKAHIMFKMKILLFGDDCSTKEKLVLEIVYKWQFIRAVELTKQLEGLYCTKDWLTHESDKTQCELINFKT